MKKSKAGFTLIELSIVLVIIGLVLGGVLVGRDLIDAAKMRLQISQFEKYRTAVNTFRVKYDGIPGDLAASKASSFGMASRSGAAGHGDGDGLLEYCDGAMDNTRYSFGCELALFWNDLSFTNLIDGSYTANVDSAGVTGLTFASGQQNSYLPQTKIGNGGSIAVLNMAPPDGPSNCGYQRFCYGIAKIPQATSGQWVGLMPGLSPRHAHHLDSKTDDADPNTGSVQGSDAYAYDPDNGNALNTAYFPVPGTCLVAGGSGSGVIYNTASTTNADAYICIVNVSN